MTTTPPVTEAAEDLIAALRNHEWVPVVKQAADAIESLLDLLAQARADAQGWCREAKTNESVAAAQQKRAEKAEEREYKYMWQVRDTCARAETAEDRATTAERERDEARADIGDALETVAMACGARDDLEARATAAEASAGYWRVVSEDLQAERDEAREGERSQSEHVLRVAREAEDGFAALEEVDAAWDALGYPGNRKSLGLAEQCASIVRERDAAEAQRDHLAAENAALREGLERRIQKAGLNAKLPDHFQWGRDAMEAFNFGKERATEVIIAALVRPSEDDTEPAHIDKVPARNLSDEQLSSELKRLCDCWHETFSDPEFEGHGGSPGEWMAERIGEIDHEIARRAAALLQPSEVQAQDSRSQAYEHPQGAQDGPANSAPILCEDCPPVTYPTRSTRCLPCPRRTDQGGEGER